MPFTFHVVRRSGIAGAVDASFSSTVLRSCHLTSHCRARMITARSRSEGAELKQWCCSRAPNRRRRDFERHHSPRSRDAKQHPCSRAPSCSDITRPQRSSPKLRYTHETSPLHVLDTQCFRNASSEPRRLFDRQQSLALPAVRTPRAASKAQDRALFGVLRTMLSTGKGRL